MSLGKSITESRGELWSLEAEGPACRTGAPGAASGGGMLGTPAAQAAENGTSAVP